MVKTKDINVSVYEILVEGKKDVKVQVMFALDGINLARDEIGAIKPAAKAALQNALKEALSKWEFE
jgi:hypothetical protein